MQRQVGDGENPEATIFGTLLKWNIRLARVKTERSSPRRRVIKERWEVCEGHALTGIFLDGGCLGFLPSIVREGMTGSMKVCTSVLVR